MIEHLTQKQVEDFCRQQLRVAELLPVSDHLGECEACRQRLECAMNGDATFFALRSELFSRATEISSPRMARAHLSAEQMAGYVDRNLSGEEIQIVADHLTGCEQCALAVDDLRAFSNEIAPTLEREYHPAAVSPPTEGWWHLTVASLQTLFRKSPTPAFGAALAILLLAVTGWLIWRTLREREPRQEIAVAPAPTSQPDQPSQPVPPPQPEPSSQPAPMPVVAQLNDGEGQLTLDHGGKLSGADGLPPAYRSMLKEALMTRRIERSSQLNGLARPSSPLMSTDKERSAFSVTGPVGEVLLTPRPTFSWSPMEGATAYVVEVYDSRFNPVAASPQLTKNSWTPPQSLARGGVYSWQVKAIKDGQEFESPRPPAPQARFRILDQAKANELQRARRAYPSSHLTLGLLYAEAGLLKEAEQELRLLRKANPGSEIARHLLNQIQALRR
ncbi:MAG: zf-HC2 domain-containing protein [Pyrinomonadaceae bacterium]